ncbi:hypothetical protein EV586_104263 [Tumebacillus sp. BK434]|uniref:hypothetical protein n=1 Tax=Tumebacillus sp. BK434 TaxID=2512169 RepID=UPI00104E03F0|nr:hypothetical protein [Tumebacillus sp. BK434]TCP54642.1 hypothetical protein EV586_104263 [Tumebacillus sp. BK434]
MLYRYQNKMGWLLLVLTLPVLYMIFAQQTIQEAVVLALLYVLLLGLLFMRHFVLKGVRVAEEGLVVERRLLPSKVYPWQGMTVVYHPKERRLAEGLEIQQGDERGQFLALTHVADTDQLRAELEERLGSRYRHGKSDV